MRLPAALDRGTTPAALVREAIDCYVDALGWTERKAAGERLSIAPAMPVDDWERLKEDLLDLGERS